MIEDKSIEYIISHIRYIEDTFNVKIHFAGLVGNLFYDIPYCKPLLGYTIHDGICCLSVKQLKEGWKRCIIDKKNVCDMLKKDTTPYECVCHAGIRQFIVPIIYKNMLIGYISASAFYDSSYKLCIKKICNDLGYDSKIILSNYNEQLNGNTTIPVDLKTNMISLSMMMKLLDNKWEENDEFIRTLYTQSSQTSFLIQQVIEYLQIHISEKIYIQDIADFFHCSKSNLQHLFIKHQNCSISDCLKSFRINYAKTLLKETKFPISKISYMCGFDSPNYFTRVFTNTVGVSPKKFRM